MRYTYLVAGVALGVFASSAAFGQTSNFSITNYQIVSQQVITATRVNITYRADLVNSGPALGSASATVISVSPFTVRVAPGQDTLQFAPVPANGEVTSSNTFTIQIDSTVPFSFSTLQWSFQGTAGGPVANAGPNQTAAVGSLVTLNGSASTNPSGVGTLTYSWTFTSLPAGSNALLGRSSSVMPTFVVDVPGTYVITLTVSNGVTSSSASVTVTTSPGGTPPVANAGPNQTVPLGSVAVLNGSASTSVAGRSLVYAWTLLSVPTGSTTTLVSPNTATPTFLVDKNGTYVAQLIVYDGLASSPSNVTITTQATPPVANAGPNQFVNAGAVVQLNGSGSTDANGLSLTFQWSLLTIPAGSAAALSNPTSVNPTFTADRAGTYIAQLIVNNGKFNSAPSTVTITTQAIGPTANAGANQSITVGALVTLHGSGSDPQNLPLTYQWALISKPAGSTAGLSSTVVQNPFFIADLAGTYIAQLIVNNGLQSSAPSTVTISTGCAQPTANAGPNQNVAANSTVTLNGSASGDSCHDVLTYAWSFTSRPAGSAAVLSGASTVSPTFVADVGGMYVVQLIVNNGINSTPSTVTVTAAAGSDIILPANLAVAPGQSVALPITLAAPAPSGGVFVTISTSDSSKVTVTPNSVFIPQGSTVSTRPPTLTGGTAGTALITASASGLSPATQSVQVGSGGTPTIVMSFAPLSFTVNAGATQTITLNLSSPAPSGGLTVNLSSSNPAAATVQALVNFGTGATSMPVIVTGVAAGSATITSSAAGIANASAGVTVAAVQGGGSSAFSSSLNLTPGTTQNLTLTLSGPATAGLTASLSSSNPGAATVPAAVAFTAGATSVSVPVTGVAAGATTISAVTPNFGSASASVTVSSAAPAAAIILPTNLSVAVGQTVAFPVSLAAPAPSGGVFLSLTSSNTSTLTIARGDIFIPQGATASYATPPAVTGVNSGSVSVTAIATGFAPVSQVVQVGSGGGGGGGGGGSTTMSFAPTSLVFNGTGTQNFTLSLSSPAPAGGLVVSLSSSNAAVASVPLSVTFPAGTASAAVPVTSVASGSVTITASAAGIPSATAPVTVTISDGGALAIGLPSDTTVAIGVAVTLAVTLPTPAPPGGVIVTLTSSNNALVTVTPTLFIAGGTTTPAIPAQVTGVSVGSAAINATAAGYTQGTGLVLIIASGGTSYFSPTSVTIGSGITQTLTALYLTAPAPIAGAIATLTSSNPAVVTVPSTVAFFSGGMGVAVPLTGVSGGSATITATTPNFGTASVSVTVSSQSVSVTWYGACWQPATFYDVTGNFHAVDIAISTPVPVTLQGSLYFTSDCTGVPDNMNDVGSTTSGHTIQGFSHYADFLPSSALYWVGPRTADGKCAPGSPCSGCLVYTASTPDCSLLP